MDFTLRRRSGARSVRLSLNEQGTLTVTTSKSTPLYKIHELLRRKAVWIEKHRQRLQTRAQLVPSISRADYLKHRSAALKFARHEVAVVAKIYSLHVNSVSIGYAATRWGSCSTTGRLRFNYRLIFLPPELAHYLIVHEVCHLQEHNHSIRFWQLVEKAVPNYPILRRRLRA